MRKQYEHFTVTERERLYESLNMGISKSEIANILGKHRASVYREISRNVSNVGYLPDRATNYYMDRRKKLAKLSENTELRNKIITMLKNKLSPKQIVMMLKKHEDMLSISAESIYKFIYSAQGQELGLSQYLRRKRKKRKSRKTLYGKKTSIPNRTPIKQRPEDINNRDIFAHWEGDLMIFSKQKINLITLRERYSRVMLAIKNETKESESTIAKIINKFKMGNKDLFLSCTLDNGGEFARHEKIIKTLNAQTYFCDPYSSYQKGSVEQGNGIIRVELPRNTDLGNISQRKINSLMRNINNRPMELHDGLSPSEVFMKMCGRTVRGFVALQI